MHYLALKVQHWLNSLPYWIDLKITGYVSEAAEAPRLC